jgi:hypothetical protein
MTCSVSTVDHICLSNVLISCRLKLLEDHAEQQKDQLSTAYANLETIFDFMKRLQEGVNSKAHAAVRDRGSVCV